MSDAELARNYILDRLSDEDRAECERRFLFDPEFESLMLEQERELLDDYVNSRLSDDVTAAVRQRVVQQPGELFRLRFAEGLRRAAVAEIHPPPKESRFQRWRAQFAQRRLQVFGGFAAATALAVVIVAAMLTRPAHRTAPGTPQSASSAPQPRAVAPASSAPSQAPAGPSASGGTRTAPSAQRPASPATTATFLLLADQQRGAGEETSIALKPGTTTVRLQLTTQEGLDPGTYDATVNDVRGTQTFSASHLVALEQAGRRYVELRIPTASLAPGEYALNLANEKMASQPPLTFRFQVSALSNSAR